MTIDGLVEATAIPGNGLEDLKARANEMVKHWYSGFGNTIQGLLADVGNYIHIDPSEECKKDIVEKLHDFDSFYAKIPFDSLRGKDEFIPLFAVKQLLPLLRHWTEEAIKEPSLSSESMVDTYCRTITTVGELYRDNLIVIMKKIVSMRGGEDFFVETRNSLGNVNHRYDKHSMFMI